VRAFVLPLASSAEHANWDFVVMWQDIFQEVCATMKATLHAVSDQDFKHVKPPLGDTSVQRENTAVAIKVCPAER